MLQYVDALHPQVLVPCHHENWAPPITANAATHERPLQQALDRLGTARPRLVMLRDPDDYVRPDRLTLRL